MKTILIAMGLLASLQMIAPSALAQTPTNYQRYIDALKIQIEQNRIEIERLKLAQVEYRANRKEGAAKLKDAEIKRYQNMLTLKQQEMSMYQQQDSLMKQPFSPNPNVAAVQSQMRQLTFERARLGLQQTAATQSGNTRERARLAQEISNKQLKIQAKQQEIKLLEMKAKAGQ